MYPIKNLDNILYIEEETRFTWIDNQDIKGFSKMGINELFDMNGSRSLYGASKFSSELFIREFGKYKNLKFIINRCSMIAGPWQMGKIDQGIIAYWLFCHIFEKKLKYIGFSGSGKQVRDILHIADLCSVIDKQLNNWSIVSNQIFNIGGGKNNGLSLIELTKLVNEISGIYIPISKEEKKRDADIRIFLTDNTKIKNILNWEPKLDNKKIIEDTFNWIINNKSELEGIL